jgi:hypothetical protein
MIETEVIAAAVVDTSTYFVVGWFVFEVLLGPFMSSRTKSIEGVLKSPEESSTFMLLVSCASYALLIAILMSKNYTNIQDGAHLGAIVGILVAIMTNSYWYATSHFFIDLTPVLVHTAAAGVTVGLMGGVIALTLGCFGEAELQGDSEL